MGLNLIVGFLVSLHCFFSFYFNSPYLLMFGDDRVTCYTRAYDVSGGTSDP